MPDTKVRIPDEAASAAAAAQDLKAGQLPNSRVDLDQRMQLVSSIVRNVAGVETMSIEPILDRGMSNEVTIAETRVGRLVVRTNKESHLFRFEREAWGITQAAERGALVPTILGCGIEGSHSFSVAEFIENSEHIHAGIDKLKVWEQLGSYAALLNSIEEDQIDLGVQRDTYFPVSWEQTVGEDIAHIFKDNFWITSGVLTSEEQVKLAQHLSKAASIEAPRGLCQFDICCENALICNGDYRQVHALDLEWLSFAPTPHYQLACVFTAWGGSDPKVMNAFKKGYGISEETFNSIKPEMDLLVLLRILRSVSWVHERKPQQLEAAIEGARPFIEKWRAGKTATIL